MILSKKEESFVSDMILREISNLLEERKDAHNFNHELDIDKRIMMCREILEKNCEVF